MVQPTADHRSESFPGDGDKSSSNPNGERRAVGRALKCWDQMRAKTGVPTRADCLAAFDSGLTDGVILIEYTPKEEDDVIVECGPLFCEAFGRDPVGLAAKNTLPSSTNHGLILWRVAAEMKKPIADVGDFTNLRGEEVVYRSVILPISEDGGTITHLMATFSYKAAL